MNKPKVPPVIVHPQKAPQETWSCGHERQSVYDGQWMAQPTTGKIMLCDECAAKLDKGAELAKQGRAEETGQVMDALSRLYDIQRQLVRAVEADEQGEKILRLRVIEVVSQIDYALKEHNFKRADFWPPDSPEWKPDQNWRKKALAGK
jgi:hypothetical protein